MRTSQAYESDVEKLRLKHTYHFERGEWVKMQTIGRKIRETWDAFHRAQEREQKAAE